MLFDHAPQRTDFFHHLRRNDLGLRPRLFGGLGGCTFRLQRLTGGWHPLSQTAFLERRDTHGEIFVALLARRRGDDHLHFAGGHGHDFHATGDGPVGQDDRFRPEHFLDLVQGFARCRCDKFSDVHDRPPMIEVSLIRRFSGTSPWASTLSWGMLRRRKRDSSGRRLPGTSSTAGKPSSS